MVRGLAANYPPPNTGLSIFLQVPRRLFERCVRSVRSGH
jgi:hypothetical protein